MVNKITVLENEGNLKISDRLKTNRVVRLQNKMPIFNFMDDRGRNAIQLSDSVEPKKENFNHSYVANNIDDSERIETLVDASLTNRMNYCILLRAAQFSCRGQEINRPRDREHGGERKIHNLTASFINKNKKNSIIITDNGRHIEGIISEDSAGANNQEKDDKEDEDGPNFNGYRT